MATTKKRPSKKSPPAAKPAAPSAKPAPAAKAAVPARARPAPSAPARAGIPSEGGAAPAFSLAGSDGSTHSLAGYAGKKVVLYFYPKDDTPGCTREALAFSAQLAAFAKKNAVVLGVSKDSVASHCRFRDKHELGVVLLSDPDLAVHRAYGVYGEKMMYGKPVMGVIRSTFVIGADGRLEKVFSPVKVDGHAEAVLAAL
jgi:peroxiredoxin Q/BCP